jgi:hypothetical protein
MGWRLDAGLSPQIHILDSHTEADQADAVVDVSELDLLDSAPGACHGSRTVIAAVEGNAQTFAIDGDCVWNKKGRPNKSANRAGTSRGKGEPPVQSPKQGKAKLCLEAFDLLSNGTCGDVKLVSGGTGLSAAVARPIRARRRGDRQAQTTADACAHPAWGQRWTWANVLAGRFMQIGTAVPAEGAAEALPQLDGGAVLAEPVD